MMLGLSILFVLPLVAGHGGHHHRRDATLAVTPGPFPTAPVPSVHLASTNPTAIPLQSLIASFTADPAAPLSPTFAAGTSPTLLPQAPRLPSLANFDSDGQYPPLDKTPPIDSPEVQAWIAQVQLSGITIPALEPTLPGGCPSNTAFAADTTRCWWTCTLCTRPTDIVDCPKHLTWGLTYDDGPGPNTPNLLDYLEQQNLKATFFIIGSRAVERPNILQTEYMTGHQIGVHTWSHPMLTTLTTEQVIAELGWAAKAIKDITGVTPNTMRPPYGDIDDRVRAISLAMGMTPIIWTTVNGKSFDTQDFDVEEGTVSSVQCINNFENIMSLAPSLKTGFIVLEHDLFAQTVDLSTGYFLPDALAQRPKLTLQPIVTCQGRPLADAYVETNNNATNPPTNINATFTSLMSSSSTSTSASLFGPPQSSSATGSTPSSSSNTSAAQPSDTATSGAASRAHLRNAFGAAALLWLFVFFV